MTTDEKYEFSQYAIDINGSGIIDADGRNLTVDGDYPLQPGEFVAILRQSWQYLGTDGAGSAIFKDASGDSDAMIVAGGPSAIDYGELVPFPQVVEEPFDPFGEPGDEPAASPELSIAPFVLDGDNFADRSEGNDTPTPYYFLVKRSGEDLSAPSSVEVVFDPGDTDADDFVGGLPETQTVNFNAGEEVKLVTVTVQGDLNVEPDESFTLTLQNAVGGAIDETADKVSGTILNDDEDATPSSLFSISPPSISKAEGNTGATEYRFVVSRSDSSGPAAVQVAFDRGDTNAADFGDDLPGTQTVFFEPNVAAKIVTYSVSGDFRSEDDETFSLSLINPVGASIDAAASSATGVITDDDGNDDPLPTLSITDTSQPEGDDGTTDLVFTVTRTGTDLSQASTVVWTATPSGADPVDGGDFVFGTTANGVLTFGPGETEKTITFAVLGDTEVESDETFTVELSEPTNATLAQATATGTIQNDDAPPTSEITGTDGEDIIIPGYVSDGVTGGTPSDETDDTINALGGDDLVSGGGGADTIDGGTGNDILLGRGGDDTLIDSAGQNILDGGAGDDTLSGGTGVDTYVFSGDHGADTITSFGIGGDLIDLSNYARSIRGLTIEANGADTVISGYNDFGNTITLKNVDPSRLGPEDFIFGADSNLIVGTGNDDVITPDLITEGVNGSLTNGPDVIKALGGADTVDGAAGNDVIDGGGGDDTLDGGAGDDTLAGGNGADTLNGGPDNDVLRGEGGADTLDGGAGDDLLDGGGSQQADVFVFAGANGTDTITDFEDGFDRIDFTAYDVSSTEDFVIEQDGDDTVISGYAGAGNTIRLQNFTAANLGNDDFIFSDVVEPVKPPELSIAGADAVKLEGNTGADPSTLFTFTVTRDGDDQSLDQETTVQYTTEARGRNPVDGEDFVGGVLPSGTVTFAAGQTSQTITLEVQGDLNVEPGETLAVNLSNATNATIVEGTAVGVIQNDDEPPGGEITGTENADTITPEGNSAGVTGGPPSDGPDTINALGGRDTVDGGGGDDIIDGGDDDDDLFGGAGNDTLIGGEGYDTLEGGPGNDTLKDNGTSYLDGGADVDTADFSSFETPVTVDLEAGTAKSTGTSTLIDIENVIGSEFGEQLRGDSNANTLLGNAGQDTIFGQDGNDTLDGGADRDGLNGGDGNDTLDGGAGPDELRGDAGNDTLDGGADDFLPDTLTGGEDDDIFVFTGNNGKDIILDFGFGGGDLIDLSDYEGVDSIFDLDVVQDGSNTVISGYNGDVNTITLSNVDREELTSRSFIFAGGNSIYISDVQIEEGSEGSTTEAVFTVSLSTPVNATVTVDYATQDGTAAAGSDYTAVSGTLTFAPNETEQEVRVPVTGDGAVEPNESFFVNLSNPVNDVIADGQGEATILDDDGNALNPTSSGADQILDGTDGDDVLQGGDGDDALSGAAGDDTLTGGAGDDTLDGGAGDDVLAGGSGDDALEGGAGDDVLGGGSDNDTLEGGAGDDTLAGGSGDDQLSGGAGNDALIGGSGNDTFVYRAADGDSGQDTIRLFHAGEDSLAFEDYGEKLDTFSDLDTSANGVLDEADAHVSVDAGNTVIDLGGQTDGDADGTIKLVGVTGLEADDMSFS